MRLKTCSQNAEKRLSKVQMHNFHASCLKTSNGDVMYLKFAITGFKFQQKAECNSIGRIFFNNTINLTNLPEY